MKKSNFRQFAGIIITLWFACGMLYSQTPNLKTEILVYILPDSLELPLHEKGILSLDRASIKSLNLKNTLKKIKAAGMPTNNFACFKSRICISVFFCELLLPIIKCKDANLRLRTKLHFPGLFNEQF